MSITLTPTSFFLTVTYGYAFLVDTQRCLPLSCYSKSKFLSCPVNYGTNLSIFPSLTKDNWGLKNFWVNYGLVFSAWGVGGFVMGRLSRMLVAKTGAYTSSFLTAAALLLVGAALALALKRSTHLQAQIVVKDPSPSLEGQRI